MSIYILMDSHEGRYKYKNEQGFTLVELLVTVAIIGILASIAIPQFSSYRERAYDSSALSDLRNIVTAQEAYYIDSETYHSCTTTDCTANLPGYNVSGTVCVNASTAPGGQSFTANAGSFNGSDGPRGSISARSYSFDSAAGVFTEDTTGVERVNCQAGDAT